MSEVEFVVTEVVFLPKPITEILGSNLCWLRALANESREDFAVRFNMSVTKYGRLERGDQIMKIDDLLMFKEKLGESADWWLTEKSDEEARAAGLVKDYRYGFYGRYTIFKRVKNGGK